MTQTLITENPPAGQSTLIASRQERTVPTTATGSGRGDFAATGYIGPIPIFTRKECRRIQELVKYAPPPLDWNKGRAASSRVFFELGSHRAILDHVTELLGDDVMLWGASLLKKRPGNVHPWHTDIETSGSHGDTVTVWIGLTNTNRHSALQLVSHSHRFGLTVQEQAAEAGKRRNERSSQEVEIWAKTHDPLSRVMQFDMADGDALFFDGRLWHGSNNTTRVERTALILQYAVPERPIRIPNLTVLEWPFRSLDTPRPPCIMVRGTGTSTENRLVAPPLPDRGSRPFVSTRVETLDMPLKEDEQTGWQPYPIFRGPTSAMGDLSCHVSVLSPGTTPHPPHAHEEEEILVVLSEKADLVIVDDDSRERIEHMEPGKFVYYPSQQLHTIRNVSQRPVTYLMFKWSSDAPASGRTPLPTSVFDYRTPSIAPSGGGNENGDQPASASAETERGFAPRKIFEGPTRYLHKLHGHFTTLAPGHGYPPHVDAYDVAIITLSGTIETLGRRVGPDSVIFYAAGEPHGMKNVGEEPATYLVFEFHRAQSGPRFPTLKERLKRTLPDPVFWMMRKGRSLVRRLRR